MGLGDGRRRNYRAIFNAFSSCLNQAILRLLHPAPNRNTTPAPLKTRSKQRGIIA